MSYTLTTQGECKLKTGVADATIDASLSSANLDKWGDEAEGLISSQARYDVVTNYASLTTEGKKILSSIMSAWVAQKIAFYLRDEYSTREMELLMDALENDIRRGMAIIRDDKIKTYLNIS